MGTAIQKDLMDLEWLKTFGIKDPQTFSSIYNYRTKDAHRLCKESEVIFQEMIKCCVNPSKIEETQITRYLTFVIHLYCHCIESIKLARAVEKFLSPWKASHQEEMKRIYHDYIVDMLEQPDLSEELLVIFSNLLEQNSLVRESVGSSILPITQWTSRNLDHLVKLDTSTFSKVQTQQLYALIKIALQLFQSCHSQTYTRLWAADDQCCPQMSDEVNKIIVSLLQILHSQQYTSECTILAGTAVASVLVSIPNSQHAVTAFLSAFKVINSRDMAPQVINVLSPLDRTKQSLLYEVDAIPKLGTIALIKGIIACGTPSFLKCCSHEQSATDHLDNQSLMMQLFPVIFKLCSDSINLHYHAFTVLHNWYLKLVKFCSNGDAPLNLASDLVEKTLELVWLHWDSPVEDVAELVTQCLKCLLEFWKTIKTSSKDKNDIYKLLLSRLQETPWSIKGKYKVLGVLIPFLSLQELTAKEDLPRQMLTCLSTNYLAPSGGEIYRIYLQFLRQNVKKEKQVSIWADIWLKVIHEGVQSTVLTRSKIFHYWISATVKILPAAGVHLQEFWEGLLKSEGKISCREKIVSEERNKNSIRHLVLHAYVVVSKIIRAEMGMNIQNTDLLKEALFHNDEDLRSDAIAMICISLKKAEPLSDVESDLLKDILPYNIKVDSAPFRQHLSANLKKLLVRVRDSSLTLLKAKDWGILERSLAFVEWLHTMCITNLIPGSCYQRRKTSLDILLIIYEAIIYRDNAKQRKAFTPAAVQKLVEHAKTKGLWNFSSTGNTIVLLQTLMDGADEVQELAGYILTQYHTLPFEPDNLGGHTSAEKIASHLLTSSLKMCNSPKPCESQSGSLLYKIIFQKYIVDGEWRFEVAPESLSAVMSQSSDTNESSISSYLSCIISNVQLTLSTAESNVVAASQKSPIHGFISALTRCISETSVMELDNNQHIAHVIHTLINVNMDIIDTMLRVMARGSQNDSCPSFADIGEALESWIEESMSEYSQSTSLSAEYQYLLSWCWVNVKESCSSLGTLSQVMLKTSSLKKEMAIQLKDNFLKILTKCRHRGVIEGCRSAFMKFCSSLFESADPELYLIPQKILEELFHALENTATQTSTTRKSAGLPIIVQSIITCENKLKKTSLLNLTLERLFVISGQSVPADFDDCHDLPQVYALNILNSLFYDASLSAVLMPYVGRAVIVVVDMFGSPAWAIRNAATRFFSSLVVRIFGQKKSVDDMILNTVTIQELFAHFPELNPFILNHLELALQREITAIEQLHPSLFPILTLLANLGPTDYSSSDGNVDLFRSQIWQLLPSPVYYLRQLASSAYVALTARHAITDTILSLLSLIPNQPQISRRCNLWHSIFLCVEKLIKKTELSDSKKCDVVKSLCSMLWILQSSCCSDLVIQKYVDIVSVMYQTSPHSCGQLVEELCQVWLEGYQKRQQGRFSLSQQSIIRLSLQKSESDVDSPLDFIELVNNMDQDSLICLIEGLSQLLKMDKYPRDFWQHVYRAMTEMEQEYPPLVTVCFLLITDIHLRYGTDDLALIESVWRKSMARNTGQGIVRAATLELGGICISCQIKQRRLNLEDMKMVCKAVRYASEMAGNENHRLSAARVILIVGEDVLHLCATQRDENLCQYASQLIRACMNLIQDDDTDIRDLAVKFLSRLHFPDRHISFPSVQYNNCLQLLLDYICDQFWWSLVIIQDLLQLLYRPGKIQCIVSSKGNKRKQLYEQDDNSFFAEHFFTGLHIGKLILNILNKSAGKNIDHLKTCTMDLDHMSVLQDLNFVYRELKCCEGCAVINLMCDPSVLASVCHLLLYAVVIVRLHVITQACNPSTKLLKDMCDCIVQHTSLPPSLRKLILQDITDAADYLLTLSSNE